MVSFPPKGRHRLGTPRVLFGRSRWDTMLLAGWVSLAEVLGRFLLKCLILPPAGCIYRMRWLAWSVRL